MSVLIRRGEDTQEYTEQRPREDEDRDWNDVASGNANTYQKLEKAF